MNLTTTLILSLATFKMIAQTVNSGGLFIETSTRIAVVNDLINIDTGALINSGELLLYSNIENNGSLDYIDTSSRIRFLGEAEQVITGEQTAFIANVSFENSSGDIPSFLLMSSISILNEVNFLSGIITLSEQSGNIFFESDAFHVNTSDDSHIDGYVTKQGPGAFTYPIGSNGFYRFIETGSQDVSGGILSSKYFLEDPDALYPRDNREEIIAQVDDNEYWELRRDQGVDENVFITLSWKEGITPNEFLIDPENSLHVLRWDASQNFWEDLGGVVDLTRRTVTTLSRENTSSIFTLGLVNGVSIEDSIVIKNGVSPNDDGVNDYFKIENISLLKNNTLEIYNRWGVQVFKTVDYDSRGNVFSGISTGTLSISPQNKLPSGTYYYILTYDSLEVNNPRREQKVGYLYLTTD